jgi:hypothetical protein
MVSQQQLDHLASVIEAEYDTWLTKTPLLRDDIVQIVLFALIARRLARQGGELTGLMEILIRQYGLHLGDIKIADERGEVLPATHTAMTLH